MTKPVVATQEAYGLGKLQLCALTTPRALTKEFIVKIRWIKVLSKQAIDKLLPEYLTMSQPIYRVNPSVPLKSITLQQIKLLPATIEPMVESMAVGDRMPPETGIHIIPHIAGYCTTNGRINHSPTGDVVVDSYKPRTELGRKLLAIRKAYLAEGGRLLEMEDIDAEARPRSGDAVNA